MLWAVQTTKIRPKSDYEKRKRLLIGAFSQNAAKKKQRKIDGNCI